jgi:hypothetical protein
MAGSLHLRRHWLWPAVLAAQMASGTTEAAPFAAAQVGAVLLREEGHAPPLCCGERESWSAPGARVGGRIGYALDGGLFADVDLALAVHRVVGRPGLDLTLWAPEGAASVGYRFEAVGLRFGAGLGLGLRAFLGTAHEGSDRFQSDLVIEKMLPDVRVTVGAHAGRPGKMSLGAELFFSKIFIEQDVVGLSLVLGWDL